MAEVYRCKYLTGRRLKIFLAVADRIVPPDEDSPGAGTMQTAGIVDWSMGRLQQGLRSQSTHDHVLLRDRRTPSLGTPFQGINRVTR